MRSNLRSIFFSLAALVAVGARADGTTTAAGQDADAADRGDGSGAWAAGHAEGGHHDADDGGYAHAQKTAKMGDQVSGSASGEPRQGRHDTLDDWNRNQFLRQTWDTP